MYKSKVEKIIGSSRFGDRDLVEPLNLQEMDQQRKEQIDAAWEAVEKNYYERSNFGPAIVVGCLTIGGLLGFVVGQILPRIGG